MNDLTSVMEVSSLAEAPKLWLSVLVTLVFAGFGRIVRGVTNSGAAAGAVACWALLVCEGWGGFAGLCAVFMLTWAATRFGYARKQSLGTAEARSGRTALQVLANLGVAAICAVGFAISRNFRFLLAVGAALAEAAGDTVSSEVGQAVGGTPLLVTTWRRVKSGTDGAVTVPGTMVGVGAAIIAAAIYAFAERIGRGGLATCIIGGILGTICDSILGATIERKGLIGNNTVNFLSTLVAAGVAFALG